MECLLTISGRDFDVDAFLAQFPRLRPTARWRRGEARFRKPAHEDSGLLLALREETRWKALRARTMRAVEVLAPAIEQAHKAGASVGLEFALYVGNTPFTSSLSFSDADLRVLAGLRGAVTVSAHPVAEEEQSGRAPRARATRPRAEPMSKGRRSRQAKARRA